LNTLTPFTHQGKTVLILGGGPICIQFHSGRIMMKKVALQLSLLMFSPVLTFSQTVTQADREKGEQYLQQTREGVVAATKGLSEAQMKFKPGLDRGTVAQVLEDIALVENGLFQNVTEKVMKSPARAADRDTARIDAQVLAMLPDRSTKRQSAPPFMPTGRWTPAETLDHFLQGRAKTMALPESAPDFGAHVGDSPLELLDAYEWLLFMAGHGERHIKQILEVKADPNFPKN
jgi:hypothetical protein